MKAGRPANEHREQWVGISLVVAYPGRGQSCHAPLLPTYLPATAPPQTHVSHGTTALRKRHQFIIIHTKTPNQVYDRKTVNIY